MAAKFLECEPADDEFIDMEVTSFSNFFCHTLNSPPQPREFEFQMSSDIFQEKETTTSPADELFYKGKLLPLHLPPRLQMVEKLLQNSNPPCDYEKDIFEEFYSTPLATTNPTPTTCTPFESCNISPSESCQVSRELNPKEYDFDFPELTAENQNKSWTKRLKNSSFGSKLRASRSYLRSFFGKTGCSYENYASSTKVADEGSMSKARENINKHVKVVKKTPFGQIQAKTSEDSNNRHRRSFSVGIKRISGSKQSSSTSLSQLYPSGSTSFSLSNKSCKFQDQNVLKRCGSMNSEIESSIQGAIAHCKQSQKNLPSRKTASEVGFYSFSSARISVSEDQEREELCRG